MTFNHCNLKKCFAVIKSSQIETLEQEMRSGWKEESPTAICCRGVRVVCESALVAPAASEAVNTLLITQQLACSAFTSGLSVAQPRSRCLIPGRAGPSAALGLRLHTDTHEPTPSFNMCQGAIHFLMLRCSISCSVVVVVGGGSLGLYVCVPGWFRYSDASVCVCVRANGMLCTE